MTLTNLTIVCPTAGYPNTARSLYTFRKYAPGAKIIVIDQTSNGILTKQEINDLTDVYVKVYRGLGFSKAMNMGIEMADTDFICCANDDVELIHERWWDGIMEWFERDWKIAGVNPGSVKGYRDESDNFKCNCGVEKIELNDNCPKCRGYKEEYTDEDYDYIMMPKTVKHSQIKTINPINCVDGIMTWFTIFKRGVLEEIKNNGCYFDERFYPGGGEDYDINCRIYDKKNENMPYRVIAVFNSWAYHHWFGSKEMRVKINEAEVDNKPRFDSSIPRFSSVDVKYNNNWTLYGRKDKSISMPLCTKMKL